MSTSSGPPAASSPTRTPDPSASPERPEPVRTPATWRRELGQRLALGDVAVIAVGSLLAYLTRDALGRTALAGGFADEVPIAIGVIPLWIALFHLAGAYRPEYLNAGGDAIRRFLAGLVTGVLALGFTSFLFNLQLSRLFVALVAAYVFLGGLGLRVGMRRYVRARHRRGELTQRALIVGTDADARSLADALDRDPDSSYEVIGHLSDDPSDAAVAPASAPDASTPAAGDLRPVLGHPDDALDIANEHGVGLVIVSPGGVSPGTLRDVTIALEGSAVDLAVAPSLFQVVTRRMTIETVGNVPILHVDQIRLERSKALVKRTLDVVAAAGLLVVTAPLWAVAALAVRRGSPGPVLFRQTRVGQDGRTFEILKFRTMVVDAEERRAELADRNEADGPLFKIADDPRVTPAGRVLRRWSIDELPQLVNVLRGDMSMVGPRPPLPGEVADYDAWHHRRLRVRPGLTGIWQVSGRSDVPFEEAVRMDLFYIENWSLGTDLLILARTVRAVLSRQGAH